MRSPSTTLRLLIWFSSMLTFIGNTKSLWPVPTNNVIPTYSARSVLVPPPPPMTFSSTNTAVTAFRDSQHPSPTLVQHDGVCQGGPTFCDGLSNCCPSGSYCTADLRGTGACCASGAFCTSLSTPALGIPLKHGSSTPDTEESSAGSGDPSDPNPSEVEDKKGGGGGGGGHGGGGGGGHGDGGTSGGSGSSSGGGRPKGGAIAGGSGSRSAAPVPRPALLFGIPVAFARHVNAAFFSTDKSSLDIAPKVKFIGPNPGIIMAGQNLTGSASGMPRPLRLFGLPIALAQRVQAAIALSSRRASKSTPKLKFMGANPAFIRAHNQTSGCPGNLRPSPFLSSTSALLNKVKALFPSTPLAIQARSEAVQPGIDIGPAIPTLVRNDTESHKGIGWRGRGGRGGGSGGRSGASVVRPWRIFRSLARFMGRF